MFCVYIIFEHSKAYVSSISNYVIRLIDFSLRTHIRFCLVPLKRELLYGWSSAERTADFKADEEVSRVSS